LDLLVGDLALEVGQVVAVVRSLVALAEREEPGLTNRFPRSPRQVQIATDLAGANRRQVGLVGAGQGPGPLGILVTERDVLGAFEVVLAALPTTVLLHSVEIDGGVGERVPRLVGPLLVQVLGLGPLLL